MHTLGGQLCNILDDELYYFLFALQSSPTNTFSTIQLYLIRLKRKNCARIWRDARQTARKCVCKKKCSLDKNGNSFYIISLDSKITDRTVEAFMMIQLIIPSFSLGCVWCQMKKTHQLSIIWTRIILSSSVVWLSWQPKQNHGNVRHALIVPEGKHFFNQTNCWIFSIFSQHICTLLWLRDRDDKSNFPSLFLQQQRTWRPPYKHLRLRMYSNSDMRGY